VLAQLEEEFPNNLKVVYRHFPLIGTPERPLHDKAAISAQAAEAAGLQGKFWEMHDLLMERQDEWIALTPEGFETWVSDRAAELGLDGARFKQDMTSDFVVSKIKAAWEGGREIGLPGTPYLLLNGAPYNAGMDQTTLSVVIKLTLLQARQYADCPPMVIDPTKEYYATLKTLKGDIVIELYADRSPLAVNNFVFLAQNGWYDGVTFHRVLPGFIAQAGDPSGTGYGGPGYAFKNETSPGLNFDTAGLVAMANAGADSNGSQFFITYAPASQLNGSYTIFGRVISGMDVVESLTPRDPFQDVGLPPGDQIISVKIEEK
jgi:cyclophilin family peptidyl-prolyl cis-trans isomerase